MFGRKPPSGTGDTPQPMDRIAPVSFQPAAAPRPAAPAPMRPSGTGEPDAALPARPAPVIGAAQPSAATPASQPPRRPAEPIRPERDVRKLIVGKEISLTGEIAACDHLIVEGAVEASVKDCHRLDVSETGLFRGSVEIHEAEIAGRFEGQITVQGRLMIRSTGRVEGRIQYGELAVEAGGALDGEIHGHGKAPAKPAARPIIAPAPLLDSVSSLDESKG